MLLTGVLLVRVGEGADSSPWQRLRTPRLLLSPPSPPSYRPEVALILHDKNAIYSHGLFAAVALFVFLSALKDGMVRGIAALPAAARDHAD